MERLARNVGCALIISALMLGCHAPNPRDGKTAPAVIRSETPRPQRTATLQRIQEQKPVSAAALPACRPAAHQSGSVSITRYLDLAEEAEPSNSESNSNTSEKPFQIPKIFPGADAPLLTLPKPNPELTPEQQREEIRGLYQELPALPGASLAAPELGGEAISLMELQQMAYANSPLLVEAAARIEQARGKAIDAGLYPNPEAGYQADTVNTGNTAGYQGVYASQKIVTADKLKIARSVASQEIAAAEQRLRRMEVELTAAVRKHYFQALIAQKRMEISRGLVEIFQRGYQAQIDLVVGGESAPYEPLQLRVLALEANNAALRADNDHAAAWRQLAAVVNQPHLPPRALLGSLESPVSEISYERALETLANQHTDLAIAQTQIDQSELNLWLQQVTPIPDVNLAGVIQYDDTTPLNDVSFNVQIGIPLPIFNKNQGKILSAQSEIVEAHHNFVATQNDLASQLAETYARYSTNRAWAETYRNEILPDQVRTYRGVYQGFRAAGDNLDFAQVIVTQQQLGKVMSDYLNVLEAQWQAVIDLAELLQTDDFFHLDNSSAETPSAVELPPAPAEEEKED